MNLTPIRVRGKRKTSSSSTIPIPHLAANKPFHGHGKTKRSLASVRASRASRHRPTLQSLPVELLESILLYSANLALPRASPVLGAKLSGKATLLRLLILVFRDTWEQCFGITRRQLQGQQARDGNPVTYDGDASFQSDMLEMPWLDVDLMLQAQQAWADRYARDRRLEHDVPAADGDERPPHDGHAHQGHPHRFDARACFEADYERALEWPPFRSPSRTWGGQDVHPLVRMPTHLITGPWDGKKKRLLFWLTRGGIQLGAKGQTRVPWEVKLACLDAAVISAEDPDPLIVNCLVGSWVFTGLPEDAAGRHVANLRRRIEWGGDPPARRDLLRSVATALNLDLQLPDYYRRGG